jgi:transposase-like protein
VPKTSKPLSRTKTVEVTGVYSNPIFQAQKWRDLLEGLCKGIPKVAPTTRPKSRRRQQTRLNANQLTTFAQTYEAGMPINDLAREFGIHRTTVIELVVRMGLRPRHPAFSPAELKETIRLYESGKSSAIVAKHFGVDPSTVLRSLRKAGVTIRPRPGT